MLSAGSAQPVLMAATRRVGFLKPDRLVLTKLDEAVSFGAPVNLIATSSLPVSYVTNGQEVPGHIQLANSERLARMVLGKGPEA